MDRVTLAPAVQFWFPFSDATWPPTVNVNFICTSENRKRKIVNFHIVKSINFVCVIVWEKAKRSNRNEIKPLDFPFYQISLVFPFRKGFIIFTVPNGWLSTSSKIPWDWWLRFILSQQDDCKLWVFIQKRWRKFLKLKKKLFQIDPNEKNINCKVFLTLM